MSGSVTAPSGLAKATTMKVSAGNRDTLSRIASCLGGVTLDDALADVLFVYESMRAVERLTAEQVTDWRAEAQEWVETSTEVAPQ